jgi:small conductance mechanosensitive channel
MESQILEKIIAWAWVFVPKVLTATLLLLVGLWLIKRLTRGFNIFLSNRRVDDSLRPFFSSLCDTGLKVVLIFMIANTFGIETTSFIAIFSAVAFSVGLALQGSLGNFASGVLVLLFRPYKVGDLLDVAGKTGRVTEIQIFSTVLMTQQGKKIVIPNSKMTEGPIENIAEGEPVQVEIALLLSPKTSLDWLRATVQEVGSRYPHALPDRAPSVQVSGINRDDMKAQVAFWTMGEHYDEAMAFLYEELKGAFERAGIELAKERRKEGVK